MKTHQLLAAVTLPVIATIAMGCGVEADTEQSDTATEGTGESVGLLGTTLTERNLVAHGGTGGVFTGHVTPAAVIYAVQVNSGSKVDHVTFFYYQPSRADNVYAGEPTAAVNFGGRGGANRNPTFSCPANQGVIGIRGSSGSLVDRIGFVCSDVTNPDPFSPLNGFSPLWGGSGGVFFDDRCELGRIVDSFNVRSGSLIDNLQAICINAH
jgi:hypothetical protein